MIIKHILKPIKYTAVTFICLMSTGMGTATHADDMMHAYLGQKTHKLNFGGNGIDTLRVTPPKSCVDVTFNSVRLNITKKRYGKAQIIEQPKKGCQQKCVVKVKWAHKPAGVVAYNLRVTWKKNQKTCP